ncbi:hypothetical protein V1511DRAFT_519770 [Dipodascopsis uninucleata]
MATRYVLKNIQIWRNKLFTLSEDIIMTPEEWDYYFPYVENVYKIHGRSTNSKQSQLSVTMYFQCRIDRHSSSISNSKRSKYSHGADLGPQTVSTAEEEVFTAALLDVPSEQHIPPDVDISTGASIRNCSNKRTRNRKPRETCECRMKIKVIKSLNDNWEPISYTITRTSEEGHSHNIDLSDRIVKNRRVQELYHPDQPSDRRRLTAREKRAFDVEIILHHIQTRYNDLEESLRQQYPNDKRRLDTAMRRWVTELQKSSVQFLESPIESFLYS